jgi:NAD(P)-dependent dehydrogenase (short-subunit alcohol dehydrogenase family)
MRAAVDATVGRFGRLDAAVANAGSATADGVVDGDPALWRDMVLTNVLGPALLVRASIDALKAARGRIVLVGSVATGDGVGVTLIAPGRVETPFWDALGGVPGGRMLTAGQVADANGGAAFTA